MATESGNEALGTLINTKDSMKTIKNVDMESSLGLPAMYIKETMIAISEMVTGKCIGAMGVSIKADGETEFKTEKEKSI